MNDHGALILPKRLASGYLRIQLGPQCWAQWPEWEPFHPAKHVFDPAWNASKVTAWHSEWLRAGRPVA